eukprot:SAG22_NODE_2112_length_2995_cov_1.672307_2_plen_83_part_00
MLQNYLTNEITDLVTRLNRSTQDVGAADSMVKKVEDILNEHHKTLLVSRRPRYRNLPLVRVCVLLYLLTESAFLPCGVLAVD